MAIPSRVQVVQDQPFSILEAPDAASFLSTLSPTDGLGEKLPDRHLIYRGHSDASWPLFPKARRKDQWGHRNLGPDTWKNRLMAEAATLLSFSEIADRQGLPIPNKMNMKLHLRSYMGYIASRNLHKISLWPPNVFVPALSLAQHCGLPTCLLDFTWNPYAAAYFAARGIMDGVRSSGDPGFICVWVIDDGNLSLKFHNPRHSVKLLVPPASDNRTLQAQEGLFMWAPISNPAPLLAADEYQPVFPLEELLSRPGSGCSLTKVLLKQEEAKMLLHRLIKLGFDGARLFPTYEGAARATAEHTWARISI